MSTAIKIENLYKEYRLGVIGHDGPVAVIDKGGQPIGSLSRDRVVEVLFSKEP